ncbi:hypothetical protein NBT05_16335 [Aquimarina sp. ERC-38]|uniref:hypothetical protein n=1 Tax=Aquimarina sp. ERC-38 TaxID=2949996 RepID=UPI002247DE12|nr:hypothetical protein [Aquimarina sp. ERC-38]UZO80505.1 hypothetical protein NBT05_16335 [Aquimarina sp. ERC-38]
MALFSTIKTVKNTNSFLYKVVLFHVLCAAFCTLAIFVDDRTLTGVNVWIKPLKFAVSGAVYIFTVGYFSIFYPFSNKWRNLLLYTVAFTLLLEYLIILFQAGRGVQSHYNISNPLDGLLFASMGILIAINVLIMFYFLLETIRLRMKVATVVQLAIGFGWLIILVGSWVGGQMISQMAHNVGVVDGGEGIAILNWSTVAGDIRIAHFFGVHGLQIIPLFAVWLRSISIKKSRNQLILVLLFALLYAIWLGWVFYRAKQGLTTF